jgi:hypothetical protein
MVFINKCAFFTGVFVRTQPGALLGAQLGALLGGVLLCLAAGPYAFADGTEAKVGGDIETLVSRDRDGVLTLGLLPANERVKSFVSKAEQGLEPNLAAELFMTVPKAAPGDTCASIYNKTLNLSSLAGIKYYSESHGEMRVLFETSHLVDQSDLKTVVSDPSYATPPGKLVLYAQQVDSSFGDNLYRYTYYSYDDVLIIEQTNLTGIKYGIIHAIDKENLHTVIALIDRGNSFDVYMVFLAKTGFLWGLSNRVGVSFVNRAKAISGWLAGKIGKEY